MRHAEIRCDGCVNWMLMREDKINGGTIGRCHRNPPSNEAQYVPGHTIWPITHDDDWCGEFRDPQMVVDAALPKPQPTSSAVPLEAGEMLDKIRASLRDYPDAGGDVVVMNEVDRIVREAEKRVRQDMTVETPPCFHNPPVLYCSNCRHMILIKRDGTKWQLKKREADGTQTSLHFMLLSHTNNEVEPKAKPVPVDRCLCGGVGCNSCEPGGRG